MSIFGAQANTTTERVRKTQRPATAPKDSFDFRHQQDVLAEAGPSAEANGNAGRKGLKTGFKRGEETKMPESRKAMAPPEIKAAQTTVEIFPREAPKEMPVLDADLQHKIAKGAKLTNEERTAALYHPRLFQQQPINQMDQKQPKPWHIGQDDLQFRSTRKLRPQTAETTAAEETDKKRYAFVSMNAQSNPEPQEQVHRARKHIAPPSHEEAAPKPVRKPVPGSYSVNESSVSLKMDIPIKETSSPLTDKRFTRKRVEAPQRDIGLPTQHHPGRKMVAPPVPVEQPQRPCKKEYPDAMKQRCPFGTDYNYDASQSRRVASAIHEESMKKEPPRSTGLAIGNRPADQRGLLSWS